MATRENLTTPATPQLPTSAPATLLETPFGEPIDRDRLTAAQALQHPWIQTIHHLRPSFPHFVPKQGGCGSSGGGSGGGGGGGRAGNGRGEGASSQSIA